MIRWEDVGRLNYNSGSKPFVVRRRRTQLSMNATKPGTWKSKTLEVPNEEIGARSEDSIEDG